MNSVERIRAYMNARRSTAPVIAHTFDVATGEHRELREADLEAVLQTLDILAQVAGLWSERAEILETFDSIEKRAPQ